MIRQAAIAFLGVCAVLFVVRHPYAVIDMCQMVVDSATTLVDAVAHSVKSNGGRA